MVNMEGIRWIDGEYTVNARPYCGKLPIHSPAWAEVYRIHGFHLNGPPYRKAGSGA